MCKNNSVQCAINSNLIQSLSTQSRGYLSFGPQDILVVYVHHGTEVHQFELSDVEKRKVLNKM